MEDKSNSNILITLSTEEQYNIYLHPYESSDDEIELFTSTANRGPQWY